MKILICPNEPVIDPNTQQVIGVRICDIVEIPFEVAAPLYWVDCPDGVMGSTHYYNIETRTFNEHPLLIPIQPISEGAQTL